MSPETSPVLVGLSENHKFFLNSVKPGVGVSDRTRSYPFEQYPSSYLHLQESEDLNGEKKDKSTSVKN